jgi:hypothetical protein
MKAKRSENFILQFDIATWHERWKFIRVAQEMAKAHLRPDCLQLYWKFARAEKLGRASSVGSVGETRHRKTSFQATFPLFLLTQISFTASANGKSFDTFIYHQKRSICEG